MPGPNLTGRPNSDDLWIGRGEVFISVLDADDKAVKWRHLGNCPQFTLAASIETKEHFSSMEGLKSQDKSLVLSDARSVTLQIEEMSHENRALFFSGDKAQLTGTDNSAIAGFGEYLMVANGSLEAGMSYEVRNSTGVRAMNITSANLTVKTNEGPPSTLIEGVDYDLDAEFGMIFLRADSTDVTDAVTLGVGLLVTLAADAGAGAINEVRALTHTPAVVGLRFCGENAATGDKMEFDIHKVRLKASGDTSLISEDWATLTLEGSMESNEDNYPDSPFFDVRTLGSSLPQLTSATYLSYTDGDALSGGILSLIFDKPVNVDRAFVAVSGAIKLRTAATLSGTPPHGDEGEYWLNAGDIVDSHNALYPNTLEPFMLSGYALYIPMSSFTFHATTLASAETISFDPSAIGLSSPTGLALPVYADFACPSVAE